jgi:hypothetical protein
MDSSTQHPDDGGSKLLYKGRSGCTRSVCRHMVSGVLGILEETTHSDVIFRKRQYSTIRN